MIVLLDAVGVSTGLVTGSGRTVKRNLNNAICAVFGNGYSDSLLAAKSSFWGQNKLAINNLDFCDEFLAN